MNKMIESYTDVHNNRYWHEIDPFIKDVATNGKVLDIGCGPGLLLKDIDGRYRPQELIGIDLSDIMIEKAKEILAEQNTNGRVSLITQHLQEDPTLPKNLDLIVSSRVLRSFEDQEEIMKSIYASLRSGGRMVLLDWAQAPISVYETWFKDNNNGFDDLDIGDIINYHRNFSRYSIKDWHYIFQAFGFEILHSFQLNSVFCCVIVEKQ